MSFPRPARLAGAAFAVSIASAASAQQFQSVTNFPGTARWGEGVECADVDQDGDLDIFVADGDGFTSAGTHRQHLLMINKLEVGPWTLADESVARLGVHTSVAKGVTTGDVDGDGWVDALYSSAFLTAVPHLYMNRGAAQPGFFDLESAARGFTANYSSGSAQFGDLDDDGDLDVILSDAYNTSVAGRPHLFFNDGTGVFTENAAALGAALKPSHMDVQLADIDGDFDLDFIGINKSSAASGAQYLMRNNGLGTFTDASTLIATNSGNAYEGEVGDMDGDTDLDLYFVSLASFSEGAIRNNLVGLGTLTFANQATQGGLVDDNEIVLFDYDVDGDYDVLVGSLGAHEYLYRNNGGFSFTDQSVQIQSVSDSTLDCTAADLNNDGKYDLITVQGESGMAQWADKFYRNTGAADTLKPVVLARAHPVSAPAAGPVVAHARIRDQVVDDGVNYVTASSTYVVNLHPADVAVSITDAGFAPDPAPVQAGTRVTWTNNSSVPRNVASATPPWSFDSGPLPVGGTFSYVFLGGGAYAQTSAPGPLSGSVTVTGTASTARTTYSGGQLYRFEYADTQAGLGAELCFELRFRDWAGNETVTDTVCIPLVNGGLALPTCPGDASAPTPCPCANVGSNGHGCANSANANGALLSASGTTAPDTAVLQGAGMPASATAIYLKGDALDPLGVPFGDGVLCTSGALIRLRTKTNVGGASQFPDAGDPLLSVRGATPPGSGLTAHYQTYYRNAAAAFCPPETFNVTNGLQMTW